VESSIIGRTDRSRASLQDRYTGLIARELYAEEIVWDSDVRLDLSSPHVILICGKRGQGKSYTMGTITEELIKMNETLQNKISIIIIDTMGIFYSTKYPNINSDEVKWLEQWGLPPKAFDCKIFVPKGHLNVYSERGLDYDQPFNIRPSELSFEDWHLMLDLGDMNDPQSILLYRILKQIRADLGDKFDCNDMIEYVGRERLAATTTKDALHRRIEGAEDWGILDNEGTQLDSLTIPGQCAIVDVSCFDYRSTGWSIRSLIVAELAKRILRERMGSRRQEETLKEKKSHSEIANYTPITWMLIDEAHQFLPRDARTVASAPLTEWIKQGRQPGLSLVLATQQPGALDSSAISQCDIVICHRLTASNDVAALNQINQTYMGKEIRTLLADLSKERGSALVFDDTSETIKKIRTRPRQSYHGGKEQTVAALNEPEEDSEE